MATDKRTTTRAAKKQTEENRQALAEAKALRRVYEGTTSLAVYDLKANKLRRTKKRIRIVT
jgi:hypothetical protein